jgi:hypothetical protein
MSRIQKYSKKDFDIDKYIELDKFRVIFESFKDSIKSNDSGLSEFVEKQLKFFSQYTIVSYDFDLKKLNENIEKNKELIEEKNKIQRANAKYVYFLAQILLYAKHIYDSSLSLSKTEIEKNIHILDNIKQYVFNFEENAITGILYMNEGLNTIDYNKSFNNTREKPDYLFYNQFVKWYNDNLFKFISPIFDEFINQDYITNNNLKNLKDHSIFNIICNTIIYHIVKKFIDNLNEKLEEDKSKKQGGKRILKKYYLRNNN